MSANDLSGKTPPIAVRIGVIINLLLTDSIVQKERDELDHLLLTVAGTPAGVGIGKAMRAMRQHAKMLRADICAEVGVSEYNLTMMERGVLQWTKHDVNMVLLAVARIKR